MLTKHWNIGICPQGHPFVVRSNTWKMWLRSHGFQSLVCVACVPGRVLVIPPPSEISHLSTPFDELQAYNREALARAVRFEEGPTRGARYWGGPNDLLRERVETATLHVVNAKSRLLHFERLEHLTASARREAAESALQLRLVCSNAQHSIPTNRK